MVKTPKDINKECEGHHLNLLESDNFGKLYGCPLCGKSVSDNNDRFSLRLLIATVTSFILILVLAFYI
jgi:hypothetical protein